MPNASMPHPIYQMKTSPHNATIPRHANPAQRTFSGDRAPVTNSGERVSFSTVSVPFTKSP